MAKKVYEETKIAAIADTIRSKTGGSDKYTTAQMPDGVEAVFEAGKKSEYDRFWDAFQENGNRRNYTCTFAGEGWTDDIYNPKYPIIATDSSSYLFWHSNITDTKVDIDVGDTASSGGSRFNNCSSLVTIRKLIVDEQATYSSCFTSCSKLQNITIEGLIGNDFAINQTKVLSKDSIVSIVNALSPNVSGKTLTLSKTAKEAAFTADEWSALIAPKTNWTITLS